MKIFFDLLPIILFFASYKWANANKELAAQWMTHYLGFAVAGGVVGAAESPVLFGTAILLLVSILQIVVLKAMGKTVDKMLWGGLFIGLVMGGLTLWFHDETFIKWKLTILYVVMGTVMLVMETVMNRRTLAKMMGEQIELPDKAWRTMALAFVGFMYVVAALNLWVAYNFSTDTWVNFKLWGVTGLMFVFFVGMGLYLSRHMKPTEAGKAN
jgi:intracellular septation protein